MDYLYHSDCAQELPVRITNSFPPRGIVAEILNNKSCAKAATLHPYGNFNSSPLNHRHSCWLSSSTQQNQSNGFSPPPTITEIKSFTRKTPRFYTVDSSVLRHETGDNLPGVDKLIANSELTGLKELYQRVCKGSMESLKSLISRRKISQKLAFLQTSYPIRHYHQARRHSTGEKKRTENFDVDSEENKTRLEINLKKQCVLVPSPYFYHDDKSPRPSLERSSPDILYPKSRERRPRWTVDKSPIEPTVINLNNKLPELPQNKIFHSRFQTKNIRGVKKRRGDGMVAVFADERPTSTNVSVSSSRRREESSEELPHAKNNHILYGKTMGKNERG